MSLPVEEPPAASIFPSVREPRHLSYLLFAGFLAMVIALNLGPMVLSGLFAYLILDLSHRRLSRAMASSHARLLSCVIFFFASTALGWIFWEFIGQALGALPHILSKALPRAADLLGRYGLDLPFGTVQEVREAFLATVRENAPAVTRMTGFVTRRFFHIVAGVLIAVLCFFGESGRACGATFYDALRLELRERLRAFMASFELVFGAQIIVSGINTVMTAAFLLAMGIPFIAFLLPATFVLGLLPVIGGVLSNALILSAALTVSPRLAAVSFLVLVVMHKAQYLVNGRVLGASLDSPMWLIIIGIIVGELVLGVPGIVLAPALLHYLRAELQALPHLGRRGVGLP